MTERSKRFNVSERLIPIAIELNERKNREEHGTSRYEVQGMVLRRGREFSMVITFSQAFDCEKYQLAVILKPLTWRGASEMKIPMNKSVDGWSTKLIPLGNQICLQVISSADALIGKYAILFELSLLNRPESSFFQFDIDLYFLFNPWREEDACGSLCDDEINEYVMNDDGRIYMGSWDIPKCISWHFGQFESIVLLTALGILNQTELSPNEKIDLAFILRTLTKNGILNHTNSILSQENGCTSTPAILQRRFSLDYHGTNWQCAAVVCSLCRALGIPCRIVTVFDAMTEQQQHLAGNSDRTAQYIWSECWMRRDDLPGDDAGWQVVDAFQGKDDTKPRCVGPCSVAGLKWNGSEKKQLINTINAKVLTKSVGSDRDYKDITSDYISSGKKIEEQINSAEQDVEIDMKIFDSLEFDDHLNLTLATHNQSNEVRTLFVEIKLKQMNSTTTNHHNTYSAIQSYTEHFYLNPHQSQTIRIKLAENYRLWKEHFNESLRIDVCARIEETNQTCHTQKYILNEESLAMKLFFDDDVIEFGKSARLNIQIYNISVQTWKEGLVTINGFGVCECFPIKRGSSWKRTLLIPIEIVPLRKGIGQVYVTLTTDSISVPTKTILLEVKTRTESPANQDKVQSAELVNGKEKSSPPETTDDTLQTSELPSNEKIEHSSLAKVPSLDSILEKTPQTIPKRPSLDSLTDSKVSINHYATRKPPRIPSLDNLTDVVSNSMEYIEAEKEIRSLSSSSLESITEALPDLIIIEEGEDRMSHSATFEQKERRLLQIPSLDTPLETECKNSNDGRESRDAQEMNHQRNDVTKKLPEEHPLHRIEVPFISFSDQPVSEERRSWLSQLLPRLNLSMEEESDEKSPPVPTKPNDIERSTCTIKDGVMKDKIEIVNNTDVLANMDLKEWIEDVQFRTNFAKQLDQETNIFLSDDADLLRTPTMNLNDLAKPVDKDEEVVQDPLPLTSTSDNSFSSTYPTTGSESGYKPSDESLLDTSETQSTMKSTTLIAETLDQPPIVKSRRNTSSAFSNVTNDIESVLSDVSLATTASEDEDEWPSRTREDTIVEGRNSRSGTQSTVKNRASISSEEIFDDQLSKSFCTSSLALYAEFLACKIIGSALYTPSDEFAHPVHAVSNPLYEST